MSAYPSNLNNLEQWKSKQRALSSQLYENVGLLKSSPNYPMDDSNFPLPPPPTPTSFGSSTSWANQQMGNLNFPPPPPEVDNYSFASDINGNQFRYENTMDSKNQNIVYANMLPQPSIGTHVPFYACEPIDNSSVPCESSLRPKSRVPIAPSQASTFEELSSCAGINNNHARGYLPSQSVNSVKPVKALQYSDHASTAIYANLGNNNPHFGGTTGFKPNAPIKNSLRVNRSSANKEGDEVDHLTDLLVKSMENSAEPDFFGMCNKCGEKVVGEGSGCTAMEMVYHIQCFTCFECQKELRGKSFYAMESNPFCEECYLNTLEKCCVCEKPILDRILRATGKPYHPVCFTCVVCKKSLDGIPFTVDASNQIHCIDDFHKKFAPRCSVCNDPIVPEPGKTETVRVVALDRSFHVSCYKCEDCDLLLSSEAEGRGCYPLDDHILCRGCNAKRVQEITAN